MDSDEPMDTDEPWVDKSSLVDEPTGSRLTPPAIEFVPVVLLARAKPAARRELQVPGLEAGSGSSAEIAQAVPVRRLWIHRAGRDAGEFW